MEAVGQLTGGVAHDFNNLLTAVLASVEMIAHRTSDERVLRFVVNARQAAERGGRLTQQLLAFSRRQRLAPEPVDINRLVTGMQDMLTRTIGATVKVTTRLADDIPPAFVDPTQLELVILQSGDQRAGRDAGWRHVARRDGAAGACAARAARRTDGRFVCGDLGRRYGDRDAAGNPGTRVRAILYHERNGQGYRPRAVAGLRFRQAVGWDGQTAKYTGGRHVSAGLLPRADGSVAHQAPDIGDTPTGARERATIFVVDDDVDVRELVVMMLDELGYQVVAAEDGRAAMDVLDRGEAFDLLLADVAMPGLSGVDVARAVRERRGEVPVLFATGYPDLRAYHAGLEGEDMIHKPYRMSDLAARLERALRNAPARHGGAVRH